MKKRIRYFMALLLVLTVVLEGTGYLEKEADAMVVGTREVISGLGGNAKKDVTYWYDCELRMDDYAVNIFFYTQSPAGLTFTIKNCDTEKILQADTIPASSEQWYKFDGSEGEKQDPYYYYSDYMMRKTGPGYYYMIRVREDGFMEGGYEDYRITYSFDADTEFQIFATQGWNSGIGPIPKSKLDKEKLTLTKGFQYKFKTEHCFDEGEWYSTNPFVATVDQKGLVTAWRPGKADIYYEDIYGNKPYCRVTVKENAYTEKKPKAASVEKGTSLLKVYQVEQVDEKGTLEVKAVLVNRTDHRAVKLRNFQIRIKNKEGKTIVNYKKKGIKLNVASGRTKELTFVIPRSKLKIKKAQDLRQSSIKVNKKVSFSLH